MKACVSLPLYTPLRVLRGLGRSAKRFSRIDWAGTIRMMRRVRKIDWTHRFDTTEKVVSHLERYIAAYGGPDAQARLEAEVRQIDRLFPPLVFRAILNITGRDPAQILGWLRRCMLHVDTYPPVLVSQQKRSLTPLETLHIGLGQCGTFANLAAVLLGSAGYKSRLWAVAIHTWLEYQTKSGRWQLDDADLLAPTARLPQGLSMRSLLENYPDWTPLLEALPRRNRIHLAHCFHPCDADGALYQCRQQDWFFGFNVIDQTFHTRPVRPEKFPRCEAVGLTEDSGGYRLSFSVDSEHSYVVTACFTRAPLGHPIETLTGQQHDVFLADSIEQWVNRHLNQSDEIMWGRVSKRQPQVEFHPCLEGPLWLSVMLHREDLPTAFPWLEFQARPLPCASGRGPRQRDVTQTPEGFTGDGIPSAWDDVYVCARDHHPELCSASVRPGILRRFYQDLVRRRLPPGGEVLDAGCGTGEWAIALGQTHDRVVAIDRHAGRVGFLQDLLCRLRPRPSVTAFQAAMEQLPFDTESFDLVFCWGALFIADTERSLKEFFRVLRRGGTVFLGMNADGWNLHLRLDRGATDPEAKRQGRDTLYNTVWRRQGETVRPILARTADVWRRVVGESGIREGRHLDVMDAEMRLGCYERVLWSLPESDRVAIRRLELQARDLCGEDHRPVILSDLLAIGARFRESHSTSVGSQSWLPSEVQQLVERLGFEKFVWGPLGRLRTSQGATPLEAGPIQRHGDVRDVSQQHFRGSLAVWECEFQKA